jgi:hypothetical protein
MGTASAVPHTHNKINAALAAEGSTSGVPCLTSAFFFSLFSHWKGFSQFDVNSGIVLIWIGTSPTWQRAGRESTKRKVNSQ